MHTNVEKKLNNYNNTRCMYKLTVIGKLILLKTL